MYFKHVLILCLLYLQSSKTCVKLLTINVTLTVINASSFLGALIFLNSCFYNCVQLQNIKFKA